MLVYTLSSSKKQNNVYSKVNDLHHREVYMWQRCMLLGHVQPCKSQSNKVFFSQGQEFEERSSEQWTQHMMLVLHPYYNYNLWYIQQLPYVSASSELQLEFDISDNYGILLAWAFYKFVYDISNDIRSTHGFFTSLFTYWLTILLTGQSKERFQSVLLHLVNLSE